MSLSDESIKPCLSPIDIQRRPTTVNIHRNMVMKKIPFSAELNLIQQSHRQHLINEHLLVHNRQHISTGQKVWSPQISTSCNWYLPGTFGTYQCHYHHASDALRPQTRIITQCKTVCSITKHGSPPQQKWFDGSPLIFFFFYIHHLMVACLPWSSFKHRGFLFRKVFSTWHIISFGEYSIVVFPFRRFFPTPAHLL